MGSRHRTLKDGTLYLRKTDMEKMKTAMHDNDFAHISRNENFKLLTLLAKGS